MYPPENAKYGIYQSSLLVNMHHFRTARIVDMKQQQNSKSKCIGAENVFKFANGRDAKKQQSKIHLELSTLLKHSRLELKIKSERDDTQHNKRRVHLTHLHQWCARSSSKGEVLADPILSCLV